MLIGSTVSNVLKLSCNLVAFMLLSLANLERETFTDSFVIPEIPLFFAILILLYISNILSLISYMSMTFR